MPGCVGAMPPRFCHAPLRAFMPPLFLRHYGFSLIRFIDAAAADDFLRHTCLYDYAPPRHAAD